MISHIFLAAVLARHIESLYAACNEGKLAVHELIED
jgi:hypothetical protein